MARKEYSIGGFKFTDEIDSRDLVAFKSERQAQLDLLTAKGDDPAAIEQTKADLARLEKAIKNIDDNLSWNWDRAAVGVYLNTRDSLPELLREKFKEWGFYDDPSFSWLRPLVRQGTKKAWDEIISTLKGDGGIGRIEIETDDEAVELYAV